MLVRYRYCLNYEVEHIGYGVRYVLRRNPVRQQEMSANRHEHNRRFDHYVAGKTSN